MADDKKPKIDLKSRLQRMGGPGAAPPPPAIPSRPSAAPPMPRGPGFASSMPPASIPPPSGIPRPMMAAPSGAALDANNPLAAVAQPFRPQPQMSHAPLAQPQRIEVDEGAIHAARKGARRQGCAVGIFFAVAIGGIAWVAGGASQQGADRAKSAHDAHDLAADLAKAKD